MNESPANVIPASCPASAKHMAFPTSSLYDCFHILQPAFEEPNAKNNLTTAIITCMGWGSQPRAGPAHLLFISSRQPCGGAAVEETRSHGPSQPPGHLGDPQARALSAFTARARPPLHLGLGLHSSAASSL